MFNNFNFDKKIVRKKFFIAAAASVASYTVLRSFPFNLLSRKNEKNKIDKRKKELIKENPLAVNRKNTGGSDARS